MKMNWRYIALGVVFIIGLASVLFYGIQPRAIPKIKLSHFESSTVAADSIVFRLRQELSESKILFLGLEPDRKDLFEVYQNINRILQADSALRFDVTLIESHLDTRLTELNQVQGERFDAEKDFSRLLAGLQSAQEKNLRVLVLLSPVHAAAMLKGSSAALLKEQKIQVMSLLLMWFPRARELESQMTVPCRVADHDLEGSGILGCEIAQTARLNYRKKFQSGQKVGLLNQISSSDFLFLFAEEP